MGEGTEQSTGLLGLVVGGWVVEVPQGQETFELGLERGELWGKEEEGGWQLEGRRSRQRHLYEQRHRDVGKWGSSHGQSRCEQVEGKDWPFFLAWGSVCKCSVKFVCCWDEILEYSKVYYLTSNSSSKNVGMTHQNIQNSPSYFELMWFVFLNPLPVIEKSLLERGP